MRKSGDILPHLPALKPFFPYFRSMGDVASRNRYTDHEGTTHHIEGTRGGLQGDPMEMTRFCITTHQIWGRVMSRHLTTLGTAYADDAYLMGQIQPTLQAVRSFRQDADLEVCLDKCTIYMPGIQIKPSSANTLRLTSGKLETLRPEAQRTLVRCEGRKLSHRCRLVHVHRAVRRVQ